MNGGSGYGGGGGGRMALNFELMDFDGSLESSGGEGQAEHGASGTVFFKQQHSVEKTTLKIYNGYNQPVSWQLVSL